MLDADTKRRIDTARDILVGKVPDPKSQVEQITIALIYKFMDDIDAESEEWGGERSFFAGEFAQYGWARLMRSGLGGHETLNLYAEAITRMPENPGVPQLFRDIFNNAYLPYRDPETLRAFLKVIDQFSYDHSERLGDAYEYLLSVLGSQGDAGQFRTPRHIIDFIVAVLDPRKHETILDPACGTAGFLISSYKHILAANADEDGRSTLTPDDRGRLAGSFTGYDIDPGMVRLARVNMYLHDFADPHISEYDTLTSEDRWNEYADVVLANPPFMTPKGGIRPHNRFSIKAKRSEVLFVDYMAEHLTPAGRAGIIVPEGIIFQSQKAYKHLRKMLVEDYLVAVVSLPAGVFKPYSGVKTSILILDKSLARRTDHIAFFRVEADGFDLGDQRKPIDRNDLPQVQAEITEYLSCLRVGESLDEFRSSLGLVVAKSKIIANDDHTLSGERYREGGVRASRFPFVPIKELASVESGFGFPLTYQGRADGEIPFLKVSDMNRTGNEVRIVSWNNSISRDTLRELKAKAFPAGTVIFPKVGAAIATNKKRIITCDSAYDNNVMGIVPNTKNLLARFLHAYLLEFDISHWASDAQPPSIRKTVVQDHQIPLPPLEVQAEIVSEIEGYQRVIDGARTVIENYRPHITVDPEWPLVAIGELCTVERGASPRPIREFTTDADNGVNWVKIGDTEIGSKYITTTKQRITPEGAAKSRRVKPGDFILSNSMSFGRPYILAVEGCIHDGWLLLRDHAEGVDRDFLYDILSSKSVVAQFELAATGGVVNNLNSKIVRRVRIPLPSLETQQAIVAEIEAERALVDANRKLIERMERKIAVTIGRVWGEVAVS